MLSLSNAPQRNVKRLGEQSILELDDDDDILLFILNLDFELLIHNRVGKKEKAT